MRPRSSRLPVAGLGALVATIRIFLPSFPRAIVAPILMRYRANPNVQGFIKGRTRPSARSGPVSCSARSPSATDHGAGGSGVSASCSAGRSAIRCSWRSA
jgi:hypothetical protein